MKSPPNKIKKAIGSPFSPLKPHLVLYYNMFRLSRRLIVLAFEQAKFYARRKSVVTELLFDFASCVLHVLKIVIIKS